MSGFVGSYARKRRRNFFLFFIFIIIISIFVFIFPNIEIENSNLVPNDNIVPDPTKDLTSVTSNMEELELNIFQKEQKIKFRDGQIKNLQIEHIHSRKNDPHQPLPHQTKRQKQTPAKYPPIILPRYVIKKKARRIWEIAQAG